MLSRQIILNKSSEDDQVNIKFQVFNNFVDINFQIDH